MSVFSITKSNFEQEVKACELPVLIDFWAPWCGPCRKFSPVLEELAKDNPHIKVGKINVEEQPELVEEFQIMGIPAVLLFKDGKPVFSSVGFKPRAAIEHMIQEI